MSSLIISLDFELHWGIHDHTILDARAKRYFERTRELIPVLLERFEAHEVKATWATVGFLFAKDREQLSRFIPDCKPGYSDPAFNPYRMVQEGQGDLGTWGQGELGKAGEVQRYIGQSEADDPYHYGYSLIRRILETAGQELASHTFSHYYCLERGQNGAAFRADLAAAQAIARENFGVTLRSMVFPYNQFTPDYLDILQEAGFATYRSNPRIWFWEGAAKSEEGVWKRGIRLLDHYLPFDRDTSYILNGVNTGLVDLPASRFLFPYNRIDSLGALPLRIQRIKSEMTRAAQTGRHYHLWWHPHNLAAHPDKMMGAVEEVLGHYRGLRERYGMESRRMGDFAGC